MANRVRHHLCLATVTLLVAATPPYIASGGDTVLHPGSQLDVGSGTY